MPSEMSKHQDQSAKTLDLGAQLALGRVSPELAWEQVKAMVQHAIEEYAEQSQKAVEKYNLPVDLGGLSEILGVCSPIKGVSELHYANPNLNLRQIPKQPPLKVLEAVLKMLTESDRWQAPKQQMDSLS